MEYGLTSCCCANCSSGSIFTIPVVSVRVASQALRAFSKCCSASLCSIFTKLEELGLCETGGVIVAELFPVLAIGVHERKSEVLPSFDEVSAL